MTAEAWNCEVTLVADVGVAGLHRLLHQLPAVQGRRRLGGRRRNGRGVAQRGRRPGRLPGHRRAHEHRLRGELRRSSAALLRMLNSCASNVVVVNIDAGFNGGSRRRPDRTPRARRRHGELAAAIVDRRTSWRWNESSGFRPFQNGRVDSHKGMLRLNPRGRGKSRHGRCRRALRSVGVAVGGGAGPRRLPGRSPADRRHLRAVLHDVSLAQRRRRADPRSSRAQTLIANSSNERRRLAIGPGLGQSDESAQLVRWVVETVASPRSSTPTA